eukprot:TRINITY_DN68217_c0_g1_i1.p1 TRINITY_DN68217_c0_g1~~TRINITY_DN68217_c0_g1_i1.p1  ORF type:complete len:394 (+),score=59.54 TRINITY_DN68217_c0_g1_i1:243-1424(+)
MTSRSRSPRRACSAATVVQEIPVVGESLVVVGPGLLAEVPSRLHAAGIRPAAFVIVSDETVFGLYGELLMAAFERAFGECGAGPRLLSHTFKPGEASKSRATKAAVEDFMLANSCTRDSVVVALGGGVVGDLAGFVAATYMRGVAVIQIPTSTMAMLDSSVGGKTAINVPSGKNLIGAFHQPRFVFADPTLLRSLSRREIVEGLAEAIKMGVIRDAQLFKILATEHARISALDHELLSDILHKAIKHKADVVALDPTEKGVRSTLNYGHTIGHAIEALVSPKLLHGECVSIGCVAEADLACRMGHLPAEAISQIRACFEAYGLPVVAPQGLTLDGVMGKMALDKKNEGKAIRCTIIKAVGESFDHPHPVPRELMEAVVKDMLAAADIAAAGGS